MCLTTKSLIIMKQAGSFLLVFIMSIIFVDAQGITTHSYRRVETENMQEYLKREMTYWRKFAEQEVKKGNLTFWAILERVGGVDEDNAPNILIINTFNDIDKNVNWNAVQTLFPKVKMEDIQTTTLCTQMATIFLRSEQNHTQSKDTDPYEDFKYVKIVYHNPKIPGKLLDFEKNKWKPMMQEAMDSGQTTMTGWGNAMILHPASSDFPYKTESHDLFASLSDALSPIFSEEMEIEKDFFFDVEDNEVGPRKVQLYRIVGMVSATN